MSIKLELDANSIKQAISAHIAAQGFNLDGEDVEVALVNGRGGNGNRATITIHDGPVKKVPTTVEEAMTYHPEVEEVHIEEVEETIKVLVEPVTAMELQAATPALDDIMKAAEGNDNPFEDPDGMENLFPKVDPTEVETSKSLF